LYELDSAGDVKILADVDGGRDWAVRLWPIIETYLSLEKEEINTLAEFSTEDLLAEIERRKKS
jgi:hypothetical protein